MVEDDLSITEKDFDFQRFFMGFRSFKICMDGKIASIAGDAGSSGGCQYRKMPLACFPSKKNELAGGYDLGGNWANPDGVLAGLPMLVFTGVLP